MPVSEKVSVDQGSEPATDQVTLVHQSEMSIREHAARGDVETCLSLCQCLYADAMGRYCVAVLGEPTAAAGAARDTWAQFVESVSHGVDQGTVRSVVLGLARRRCAYLQETQSLVSANQVGAPGAAPNAGVATSSLAVVARNLLSRLAPSEREVVVLRYVSDLSYEEIAQIFGISLSDAKVRVSRAIGRLLELSKGRL